MTNYYLKPIIYFLLVLGWTSSLSAEPSYKFKKSVPTLSVLGSSDTPGDTNSAKITFSSTNPLSFEDTDVGLNSNPKSILVLNEGSASYLFNSSIITRGLNPTDYSVSSDCLNLTLAPTRSCLISVFFKPTTHGSRVASLDLSAVVPNTFIPLTGTGFQYEVAVNTDSVAGLTAPLGDVSNVSDPVLVFNAGNKPSQLGAYSIMGPFVLGTASSGCSSSELANAPKNLASSSCTYTFKFAPTVQGENQNGSVSFQTTAGIKTIALSGVIATREVTLSATSLAYIGVAVGASLDRSFTVTNDSQAPVSLNPSILSGVSDFSIVPVGQLPNTCATSLAPNQSCSIYVKFAPSSSGNRTGSLSLGSNGTNEPTVVSLVGTGLIYTGSLNPDTDTDFGAIKTGQTVTKSFTFENTGNTVLSGIHPELENAVNSSIMSNTCGTNLAPVSLGPGNTCSVQVQFAPFGAMTLTNAKLKINSSATLSPHILTLTGSATFNDPNAASVTLFMNMNGYSGEPLYSNADSTGKYVSLRGSPASYSTTAIFGTSAAFPLRTTGGAGGCNPTPTTAVEVSRHPSFELDSQDYTIELRVRPTGLTGPQGLISLYESCNTGAGRAKGWYFYFSGNKAVFSLNTGTENLTTFNTTFTNNNWYHLALVKSGTSVSLFVNGIKDSTVGNIQNLVYIPSETTNLRIGSIQTIGSGGFVGYIDELRMTRNVARYTSNFTPNAMPLTYP